MRRLTLIRATVLGCVGTGVASAGAGGGIVNVNGATVAIARGAFVRANRPNDCTGC
jgi:L-serine deaminase